MAVETISSTQFNNFVAFATDKTTGDKSVATLGAKDANGGFHISATTVDRVGKLRRGDSAKMDNDAVRTAFRDSVFAMFGGESRVPESVKKAMLMDDYGKGKPLTARRIMTVKNAVDAATAEFDAAVREAKANFARSPAYSSLTPAEQAKGEELASTVVKMCLSDKAALGVAVKNIGDLLTDGARRLRSDASVKGKASGLLANSAEIRVCANGDSLLLNAGKMFLMDLNGKSLPPGTIASIMRSVDKLDTSAVEKFASHPGAFEMDVAIKSMRLIGREAVANAGAFKLGLGSDELDACRSFAVSLTVAKCGSSAVKKMQKALMSDTAQQLKSLYDSVSVDEQFDKTGLSLARVEATKAEAATQMKMLDALKFTADILCGIDVKDSGPVDFYKGEINRGALHADEIVADFVAESKDQVEKDRSAYMSSVVKGSGTGAELLRGVYGDYIGPEPFCPTDKVGSKTGFVAKAMMNMSICGECRTLALGGQSMFERDVARQTVKLSDGTVLSKDFATARDQLARFVTGDPQATYGGITDRVTKNKVHIAMSLLTQETLKAAYDGHATALDPKGNACAFVVTDDPSQERREMHLDLTDSGGFELVLDGSKQIQTVTTWKGSAQVGPGSVVNASLTFGIPGRELDRLANQDFSTFDDTEAMRTLSDRNGTKNVERAAEKLGAGFVFTQSTITCNVKNNSTIN